MDLAARLGISFEWLLAAYGIVVSATVFLAVKGRLNAAAGAAATMIAAGALALGQVILMDPAGPGEQVVRASFIVIPAMLLFAAARSAWIVRRSWLLLLVGPIAFIVSYVCVCMAAGLGRLGLQAVYRAM